MKFLQITVLALTFFSSIHATKHLSSIAFLNDNSTSVKNALTAWYTEFIVDEESSMVKLNTHELQVLTNVVFLGTVTSWLEIQVRSEIRQLTYLQWQLRKEAQTYEEKQRTLTLLGDVVQRLKPLILARSQVIKNMKSAFEYLEQLDDENIHHTVDAIRTHIKGFIRAWLAQTQSSLKNELEQASAVCETNSEKFKLLSSLHHELSTGTLHLLTDDKENALVITLDKANTIKEASEAFSAHVDITHADLHEYIQGMFALSNQMYRFYYHLLYETVKALNQQPRLVFDADGFIEADDRLPQHLPEPGSSLMPYINQLMSDATCKIEADNEVEQESDEEEEEV